MSSSQVKSIEQPATTQVTPDEPGIGQTHNNAAPNMPYNNLIPSGWKAIVPVPLIKTTGKPILVLRVDPFQAMMLSLSDPEAATRNDLSKIFFSAIQQPSFIPPVLNKDIRIMYEYIPCEHYHKQLMHRIMSGTVNMVLRISANTNMTGSLAITEHQDVQRDYRSVTNFVPDLENKLRYNGFSSLNQPLMASTTFATNSAINDLSLTRHFEFSTQASCAQKFRDTYMSWDIISVAGTLSAVRNSEIMKENVVTITPLTDITAPETGQITITLLWDFTNVMYSSPILPIWPYLPVKNMGDFVNLPYQNITAYYNLKPVPPPTDGKTGRKTPAITLK